MRAWARSFVASPGIMFRQLHRVRETSDCELSQLAELQRLEQVKTEMDWMVHRRLVVPTGRLAVEVQQS